ncbi:NADP-dependent oxidoreductase [Actinomycetospora sp.]|uniref:NADP-dependent oxidoreductase n=1 Tax=Actinomycetospora sp. TaxID=1872135 RepID=UPI002F3E2992
MSTLPTTARAVRFDHYGGREVLAVHDVPMPEPAAGEVLVEVRAAGINPGESAIREGALDAFAPSTFPSGQGSDLAGVVVRLGPDVTGWTVGDEVLGWSWTRSSHASHAVVPVGQLVTKPPELSWEVAGALYVVGATAWAATQAVAVEPGEVAVVSGAAGGVGSLVVQLVGAAGADVLALASEPNHAWLRDHGAHPVTYGDGVADRLRAAARGDGARIHAFVDTYGDPYVDLAIELGVDPDRIDTIIAFASAARVGAHTDGSAVGTDTTVLTELAERAARGELEVPVAAAYPLVEVADAFAELETRHTHGKIVLLP